MSHTSRFLQKFLTTGFGVHTLAAMIALTSMSATAAPQTQPNGAVFWLGDGTYQSPANIPLGFYAGGAPTLLENFEDRSLDASLGVNRGNLLGLGILGNGANSVDADDGAIDNSGLRGVSWTASFSAPLRFNFIGNALPTAFGLVITAAGGGTTFSAFDDAGQLIATRRFNLAAENTGVVAGDRFVGLQHTAGIRAIEVSFGGGFIEVDHIQYGQMAPVPEPETYAMLLAGLGLIGAVVRRRSNKA